MKTKITDRLESGTLEIPGYVEITGNQVRHVLLSQKAITIYHITISGLVTF